MNESVQVAHSIMAESSTKTISPNEGIPVGPQTDSIDERQRRRESERDALVTDTHQREAALLEDTKSLFENLAAYLRGELSSTLAEKPVTMQLLLF